MDEEIVLAQFASREDALGVFVVVVLILFVGLTVANVVYDRFNPRN